jgi:hypothetical protein
MESSTESARCITGFQFRQHLILGNILQHKHTPGTHGPWSSHILVVVGKVHQFPAVSDGSRDQFLEFQCVIAACQLAQTQHIFNLNDKLGSARHQNMCGKRVEFFSSVTMAAGSVHLLLSFLFILVLRTPFHH